MKTFLKVTRLTLGTLGIAAIAGCSDQSPTRSDAGPQIRPVQYVQTDRPPREKPLPGGHPDALPPPPFDDVPLVYQPVPEQRAFLEAYAGVRRPRIVVFVNRTLSGDAQPVDAVSMPPPDRRDVPEAYLRPGQYDEAHAKQIDYAAVENTLTQWLACDGQTLISSPATVRERLTNEEIQKLQSGRPRLLGEVAKDLNADILVHVQAKPTRQTERGLEIRLIAEAINVQGGESIGRANVLIPPPLDTEKINRFTRFVARRLMSDMTMTWSGPGPNRGAAAVDPATRPAELPPLADPAKRIDPIRPVESPAPVPEKPLPPPAIPSQPPTVQAPAEGHLIDLFRTEWWASTQPDAAPPASAGRNAIPPEKPSILDRPVTRPVEDAVTRQN